MAQSRISPSELRWRVDPRRLESRRESAAPLQDALDSLTAALKRSLTASEPRRSHLFVRGETASRRHELLHEAIESLSVPRRDQYDFCFVHNFDRPDRPRLIRLPAGSGRKLRAQLREAACFIRDELETALNSRPIRNRVEALRDRSTAEMDRLTKPLEKRLKPHGLVLVREEVGQMVRLTVHVQQTGRTITQDDLANLVAKGQVGQDEFEQIRQVVRDVQPELRRITEEINRTWKHAHQLRGKLLRAETRRFVAGIAQPVLEKFDAPDIKKHLENIVADVVEKRVDRPLEHLADPELIYGTNLVHSASRDRLPVVHEQVPTTRNLGGTIDPGWLADRRSVASFQGIRGGSLVAAGNGLLIIDAEDLLARSDSVRLLRNVLSGTSLPIEPPGSSSMSPAISLRPDPVPIGARLVLIGTPKHWNRLARRFPAFVELFAPPVDVPATIARDDAGIAWLADQVDYLARTEGAKLSKEAVAALIEHAARLGGAQRLSTRLGEFRRLLRQAKAEAADEGEDHVTAVHVHDAVDRLLPTRPADAGADATRLRFPGRQPQPGQ
ncbi:MAG: AAA family ATPase, partial [Candidatus Wenzhouxiangella sp. M2_3B_020]